MGLILPCFVQYLLGIVVELKQSPTLKRDMHFVMPPYCTISGGSRTCSGGGGGGHALGEVY